MSDEHKNESDNETEEESFSLSGILFGNVDKDGGLLDDFLGKEASKHLKSLDQLNIADSLIDEIKDDVKESIKDAKEEDKEVDKQLDSDKKEDNYEEKTEEAVDYSDIDEMVEDVQEEDIKFREALSKLVFKMPTAPISKPSTSSASITVKPKPKVVEDDDYDSADKSVNNDKLIEKKKDTIKLETSDDKLKKNDAPSKRLDTPLAEMLPSKYENCDVTELFPEFRPNQTLRFSRLFTPSKSSLMPNRWKYLKSKKRKKKRQTSESVRDDSIKIETTSSLSKNSPLSDSQADNSDSANSTKDHTSIINDSKQQEEKTNDSTSKMEVSNLEKPEFSLKFAETVDENDVEEDQEEVLKRPMQLKYYDDLEDNMNNDLAQKVALWRYGPASYWYDMINIPDEGKIFDYGFKVRKKNEEENDNSEQEDEQEDDAVSNNSLEDCYHMVTQSQWEDEIIWNAEEVKQKVLAKNYEKYHTAGWVPSGQNRTASAFIKQVRGSSLPTLGQKSTQNTMNTIGSTKKDKNKNDQNADNEKDETWYSIFPTENEELVYGVWEDDVIWDAENMDKIPEPKILTLDPNDENIVLGIPDDIDPNAVKPKEVIPIPLKEKKEHHLKKSRILLGKAGVIAEPEPESPPPSEELEKDPYNISNDEYYNPKLVQNTALKPTVGVNLIQHSIPALELRQIFFPTYMGPIKLRSFHRPPLKRYSHGAIADSLSHAVIPLLKHMKKKAKQREQERLAAGGGDMFFMRTPEDISAKDGDLILCEYSEEHPPIMMQCGMATKIKNYYKRRLGKDAGAPEFEFGETIYAHTTPFLGNLAPGQSLQALENNLFRAPIYNHRFPESDFLIIRTRNNYFIRIVDTIFTVGQELPLYEVPGPNSKKANNFIRDFFASIYLPSILGEHRYTKAY